MKMSWYGAMIVGLVLSISAVAAESPQPPEGTITEPLWVNGAPDAKGNSYADCPTLTIFQAPADKRTGAAVIVCPGGGYQGLAITYEGYDVAKRLNASGITAFVLKYRLSPYRHPIPLQDAQRAIRIVRSRAKEWGVDPGQIGILGFSAGGHLASTAGTHFDQGNPNATDPIDRVGCRPDFLVLVYPVITFRQPLGHMGSCHNLLGNDPDPSVLANLCNDEQVTKDTPPAFLVHTTGDTAVPSENSVQFYLALRKAGIPAELHVYEHGEHGFGLGKGDPVLSTWPDLCIQWLEARFKK